MRKSFWGYNVQEVDDNIEELENAKARLAKQVKSLSDELDQVREEAAEERAKALAGNNSQKQKEMETRYQENVKELNALRKENIRIRQTNDQLSAQIASYNEERLKSGVEQASIICREAYEDMANAKDGAKIAIDGFLEKFWKTFDQYEQKIMSLYEEMLRRNETGKESFLIAADEILANYTAIDESDTELKQHIEGLSAIRTQAQLEVDTLLSELVATDRLNSDLPEAEPTMEEVEEKYQHSILREIANKHRVIAIRQEQESAKQAEEAAKQPEPEKTEPVSGTEAHDKPYCVNISSAMDKRNVM